MEDFHSLFGPCEYLLVPTAVTHRNTIRFTEKDRGRLLVSGFRGHQRGDQTAGQRRQLSGSARAGTYVALYTVGYADTRPREPVETT